MNEIKKPKKPLIYYYSLVILALLLFVGCALLFAESWEASLEAGLLNVGLVKWYLLIPCAFFLLQTILKFSAHARAH